MAVVNGSDEAAELLFEVVPSGVTKLAYGIPSRGRAVVELAARAESVSLSWEGTRAAIELAPELGGGNIELGTRAIGEHFAENALAAFVTALALGVPRDAAALAIARATPPPGRFELVASEPHVVVDYAHTPDALRRTLATAAKLARGKVIAVFGAGGDRDRLKRPALGAATESAALVFVTSDNPRREDPSAIAAAVAGAVPSGVQTCVDLDREHAIRRAVLEASPADVIVVAGKGHETTQTIGAEERPFSDVDVARRAHAERPR